MPRKSRIVVVGLAHHVTQRGNNRQDVFFNAGDRALYLHLLGENAVRERLDVVAYCLMTNHVHLVVVPRAENSLARALGRTQGEYARQVNDAQARSGHIWQSRYYSCPLGDTHLWAVMRYVERNPVRAGLARESGEWQWSSAPEHLGRRASGPLPLRMAKWRSNYTADEWRMYLADEELLVADQLRDCTRNGWALGTADFCAELQEHLGYRVRPLPPGRQSTVIK